jgi:hypothetical protein
MRFIPLVALVVAFAGVLVAPATALGPPRHTPRQAQTNVLRASRVLGRFSPALLDPRTKLLKNNSTAVCIGHGKARRAAYSTFTCVVKNGRLRVAVRYLAQSHNGFELKRIRVWRVA